MNAILRMTQHRTATILMAVFTAGLFPAHSAIIIGHNSLKSGRLTTGVGEDSLFGTGPFGDTAPNAFAANSTTLGDNASNNKFQTIFAFTVNEAWRTAYSNVDTVSFSFRVSSLNAGGGTPSDIQISLLAINDGTADPWTVATNAPHLASLGSVSGTTISDRTLDITTVLSNAAIQPSAINNTIWFGLSGGFSNNSTANNVLLNMTNASFQLPELSVVAIPEPSSLALAVLGFAGAMAMLRRRR